MKKDLSFPKSRRLINKAEYQPVFDDAKKINQRYLLALFKPNQKDHPRLGIIVGKRVAKDAVDRNRIKRTIRESFRHHQNQLDGFDIIVIARQQCDTQDNSEIRENIDNVWKKLISQQRYLRK